MTKFKAYFSSGIEQSVEVDIDVYGMDPEDALEKALEEAHDEVTSVPFIGWNFDAAGDWEPTYVRNLETGDELEL